MTQEEIYEENYPIVYGYLLSLCGDIPLAEDLAAETFFKAFLHPRRYSGQCKLSTWLCAIGRNLYLNERKRQNRHRALTTRPATSPDPEALLLEKEQIAESYRAAQQLEAPASQVFFMRLEGFSFRQIGEALGKTENWARVTFYRAKVKIQERMEDIYG
jgi:RNA polymerase sigma-70 factor (ECF subfamily)